MKGAIADPSASTIREPNNTRKIIIGTNHHFLRVFKKSHNSKNIENFDILFLIEIRLNKFICYYFIAFFIEMNIIWYVIFF
jgi:hypothetical protein